MQASSDPSTSRWAGPRMPIIPAQDEGDGKVTKVCGSNLAPALERPCLTGIRQIVIEDFQHSTVASTYLCIGPCTSPTCVDPPHIHTYAYIHTKEIH